MPHAPAQERPLVATSDSSEPPRRSEEEASAEVVAPVEEPDPFDALRDPDMGTPPKRIKRVRALRPRA
jgi:hypothetical protein